MDIDYKVRLEVFEGPLDLLLYLIKRDEIDIYDISIERITQQYLEFLDAFQTLNIELAGEFIVMAANLLYIKSRTLLPKDQQPAEEDAEEDDPRWELIRQLIEYKKFKEAASQLKSREELSENLFPRAPEKPDLHPDARLLVGEVGIFDLIRAFQNILKRLDAPEDLREIFEENHTVADKIDHILEVTTSGERISFERLFDKVASRSEVVVTFLALLELIRLKQIRVFQESAFREIQLERLVTE